MKKFWMTAAACLALLAAGDAEACTGLLVGKKASTDGSVMISYAADSHTLYGELYRWPAAVWPEGAMLEVNFIAGRQRFGPKGRCSRSPSGIRASRWERLSRRARRIPLSGT